MYGFLRQAHYEYECPDGDGPLKDRPELHLGDVPAYNHRRYETPPLRAVRNWPGAPR
jgi:hypothetical protein